MKDCHQEFVASICSSVLMSDDVTSGTSATPGVAHGAIGCHLSPPLSPRSSQPSLTASKPPSPTLFAGLMMNTPSAFSSYMHSSSTSSLFSSEDVMGALDGPERELIRRYKSRQQQRLSLERIDPQALLYGSVLPPELTIVTNTAGAVDDDTCVTVGDCGPCSTPTSSVTYVLASSTSRPVVSTSLSSGSSTGLLGYSVVPSSSSYAAGVVTSTLSLDGKRPCRKLESEDSCYETDREDGAEVSPSSSTSVSTAVASPSSNLFGSATAAAFFGRSGGVFHDDLDRTLSETLGREFQEYVTLGSSAFTRGQSSGSGSSESLVSPPQHHQLVPTTSSVSTSTPASSGVPTADPNYTAKLEFALKLGYTERQVHIAFARLGSTNPTQNELLEELIKVSTTPGLCGPSVDTDDIFGSNDDAESLPVFSSGLGRSSLSVAFLASKDSGNLRHIVIDGSNVAMSHGNKEVFSCRGIRLAVDWFKARGHQEITVFVPKWRKESSTPDAPIRDQEILLDLERERILVFTPSRLVGGRRLICYDDRYILKLAVETDGVVVSNDNYRDLAQENPEFKKLVEERILMFSFVNDRFMPPDDPLGRNGPSLSTFLRKPHTPLRCSLSTPVTLSGSLSTPTTASCSSSSDGASNSINSVAGPPLCPYGKKCTYGNKCKYLHPERGNMPHKTVTEKLAEKAHKRIQEVKARQQLQLLKPAVVRGESSPVGSSAKQPMMKSKPEAAPLRKTPLSRTISGVRMVEKSKSVDNFSVSSGLPESCYYPCPPSPPGFSSPPASPPPCSSSSPFVPVTTASRQAARFNVGPRLSDPSAGTGGSGFGGHKKLQRQLTLNPEYDPRLLQMKASSGGIPTPPPLVDDPDFYVKNPPPSFPVQQSSAAKQQQSLLQQQMFQHHQVSRIASAPDSGNLQQHTGLPSLGPRSSTSDSNLNLGEDLGLLSPVSSSASSAASIVAPLSPPQGGCKYGPISPPQRAQQPQHRQVEFRGSLPPQPSETFQQDQEYRRYKIYFHLSHLFPEEQVRAAMRACPNETSPDKICAYIISLSSNSDN